MPLVTTSYILGTFFPAFSAAVAPKQPKRQPTHVTNPRRAKNDGLRFAMACASRRGDYFCHQKCNVSLMAHVWHYGGDSITAGAGDNKRPGRQVPTRIWEPVTPSMEAE